MSGISNDSFSCPFCDDLDGAYVSIEEAIENCNCSGAQRARREWYLEFKLETARDPIRLYRRDS